MIQEITRNLINAGAHFGHASRRWNPRMEPFIFSKRGNIHIINIKKTLEGILIAKKLLAEVVASGRDVVFVGTKRQAQKAVEAAAGKCGMHYVSQRWLGGMLTNFRTIRSRLQRLELLEKMSEDGSMDGESKKQASRLKREMRKVKSNLHGIRNMSRLPGAVVVVDAKKEYLALREAKKLGITTIGILDTDSDPQTVDVAIPANDDSIRTVDLILNELVEAVAVGKTMTPVQQEQAPRPRRPHSKRPVLARAGSAREGQAQKDSQDSQMAETSQGSEPELARPTEDSASPQGQ